VILRFLVTKTGEDSVRRIGDPLKGDVGSVEVEWAGELSRESTQRYTFLTAMDRGDGVSELVLMLTGNAGKSSPVVPTLAIDAILARSVAGEGDGWSAGAEAVLRGRTGEQTESLRATLSAISSFLTHSFVSRRCCCSLVSEHGDWVAGDLVVQIWWICPAAELDVVCIAARAVNCSWSSPSGLPSVRLNLVIRGHRSS
jgi:hypothetical protein